MGGDASHRTDGVNDGDGVQNGTEPLDGADDEGDCGDKRRGCSTGSDLRRLAAAMGAVVMARRRRGQT